MPDGYHQHPPPEGVTITLNIDADVIGWLHEQPEWRREIRDLLRFYMESHLAREAAFQQVEAPDISEPPENFFSKG